VHDGTRGHDLLRNFARFAGRVAAEPLAAGAYSG
jgi:hypothetical protein